MKKIRRIDGKFWAYGAPIRDARCKKTNISQNSDLVLGQMTQAKRKRIRDEQCIGDRL